MSRIHFQLDRDHIELHQLLKLCGLCDSGGAGKHLVASGVVSVDGALELRKTCKIRSGQSVAVRIDGRDVLIDVV
jgi:ribosome-associated protein